MKTWILGAVLAGLTAGSVTLMAIGNGLGTPDQTPARTNPETPVACAEGPGSPALLPEATCELCPTCQPNTSTQVYDVVDLKTGFPACPEPTPFVSFDEPPLAKALSRNVVTAEFSQPSQVELEMLPSPRLVK